MTIDCARWDRAGDAARRGPRPTTDKGDASVSIVDRILRLGEGRTLKKLDSIRSWGNGLSKGSTRE